MWKRRPTSLGAEGSIGEKDYLRRPLKASFILTLTVVLLLSLLAAWYGAIFTAQRLVQPIQDLVQGTRAVAQGDLDTKLPLTSHDEMAFLVHSFNVMTKRLRHAREDQRRAQLAAETERAKLAVILARLSTGVISLEPDWRVRTANRAAATILGEDIESRVGAQFGTTGAEPPNLARQFAEACQQRFATGTVEWREQFTFQTGAGRRILMCACTPLPTEGDAPGGYEPTGNLGPRTGSPTFALLRELRARCDGACCPPGSLRELSMGLSADFEVAVEEGATLVRVGTALFGSR